MSHLEALGPNIQVEVFLTRTTYFNFVAGQVLPCRSSKIWPDLKSPLDLNPSEHLWEATV